MWTRITSLYGPQTWPVVLCMQNSVICNRMTCLYGFQPSSVFVFHAKQRLYHQNYKSPSVKDLTCGFWIQNSDFWTRITSLYGSQTWPVVLCMHNSGLNIRMTSLYWSQSSSVVLRTHNSVLSTKIKRLYGNQPSSLVLCMQNNNFRTRNTCLCGSKTPHVVFVCKRVTSGPG